MPYVIIIIFLILLIFLICTTLVKCSKLDIDIYNQIDNINDIGAARKFLMIKKMDFNHSPIDYYRMANIHDMIFRNNVAAQFFYSKAIKSAKKDITISNYINNRIRDRITINHLTEEDENKLDQDMIDLLEMELGIRELENDVFQLDFRGNVNNNTINHRNIDRNNRNNNDNIINTINVFNIDNNIDNNHKSLEERILWIDDTQNVHDTHINDELKAQYHSIVEYNRLNALKKYNINDIINVIRSYEDYDDKTVKLTPPKPETKHNAIAMLNKIAASDPNIVKLGVTESEFVGEVFRYLMSQKRKDVFLINLIENLEKLNKNVCITGQVVRIMSSLADPENSNIGTFQSKNVVKNEIITKASSIRNKLYQDSPENVRADYDNSVSTSETDLLDILIKQSIDKMISEDYNDMLNNHPDFISEIKHEISLSL